MNASEESRFDALYAQHLTALKLQGKAPKTSDSYARAIRRLRDHFDRCPDELGRRDFKTYFSGLVDSHSWSTVKIDLCGIKFFFEQVLGREFPWLDLVKPPVVRSLPDILTAQDLAQLILRTRELHYRVFWLATYSMGLRLSETLHLRVGDIDAQRRQVHVRAGKGRKDRFVYLPTLTLISLRGLWRRHRHPQWLFPGRLALDGGPAPGVMDRGSTQKAFARVVADCGIRKHVSIHSLRHAYATHLIEAGLNLGGVQKLLGHAYPETTARYVHMTDKARADQTALIESLMTRLKQQADALKPTQQRS
jgi:integrase/recombinase XerD